MDDFITTEETARRLRVTPQTVVRYIKDGKLNATKVGKGFRIRASDVDSLLGYATPAPGREAIEVLAFANQQLGSGKTTTAVNLAAALGTEGLGKRLLLIDFDPQGGCAAALGIDTADTETVATALQGPLPLSKTTIRTAFGFDFIPAAIDLASAEIDLARMLGGELLLRRKLEPLLDRYDFILIDCPPALGPLALNAIAAADRVIVPVNGANISVRGLELLAAAVELVKNALNPRLRIGGVLVTQYRPNDMSSREALSTLADFCRATDTPLFAPTIKHSAHLAENAAAQKPFVLAAPSEDVAAAYAQIARDLLTQTERVAAPAEPEPTLPRRRRASRQPAAAAT